MNDYTTTLDGHGGRSRSGFVNAVLGALVMIVFSWIPFAPVVGGALAGYLEAGERDATRSRTQRGLRVGALAGLLAAIPALLVVAFVASIFTVGWLGIGASGGIGPGAMFGIPILALGIIAFVVVVSLLYHVGLSALGGWLGAELAGRDDHRFDRTPRTATNGSEREPATYVDVEDAEDPEAVFDESDAVAPEGEDWNEARDDRTDY